MHCVRKVCEDIYWIGANDRSANVFESLYPLYRGMSYNSYLFIGTQTVLFDTVDWSVCNQFIENLEFLLDYRDLDYVVINHVEPDHAASLRVILKEFPKVKIISTAKARIILQQYGLVGKDTIFEIVREGDIKRIGGHEFAFVEAPMIHWPEAMLTFDLNTGVLFSADAFGSFGALDGRIFSSEVDYDKEWLNDARRYYTNIVGKYGVHVQKLIKKYSTIVDDIKYICPLHGVIWTGNFPELISYYEKWSRYEPEEKGVLIVYGSIYGNTESAAQALAVSLCEKGMTRVRLHDVAVTDPSFLIADTFKYSHIVLASVTFNLQIFPPMSSYLERLKDINMQNRTFAIIENGSWACRSGDLIEEWLSENLKNVSIIRERLSIATSLHEGKFSEVELLANRLIDDMKGEN